MRVYCGTDIIEVKRIKDAIITNEAFKNKVYTKNEIKTIEKVKSDVKYQHYAGRFAAKEAIFKAISKILCDNNIKMEIFSIEVLNDPKCYNRPAVSILNNDIQELIVKKNIQIDVSISHIEAIATAVATVKIEEE